jgi:hypothetical protein
LLIAIYLTASILKLEPGPSVVFIYLLNLFCNSNFYFDQTLALILWIKSDIEKRETREIMFVINEHRTSQLATELNHEFQASWLLNNAQCLQFLGSEEG